LSPHVAALYRYPVKGFSAELLARAEIAAGGTMPWDRAFAIENGPLGFDPAAPAHLTKIRFLMLMKNACMAGFATRFEDATGTFSVSRGGRTLVSASLFGPEGRGRIEAWIAREFAGELRGAPRILFRPGHSISDNDAKVLHLVNLASVRTLAGHLGQHIDPLRFRPNVVIDGVEPFAELGWVGRRLKLPGLELSGEHRTERCAATNVEPGTGVRDVQIPRALMQLYGHADFGIYLAAASDGTIAVGDAVVADESVPSPA
jgi:uncharacterized protein